jgi:hypothetical protein
MTKAVTISPDVLVQNILRLMNNHINKLTLEEELDESQIKTLSEMLRVLLSASKLDKQSEDEIKDNLATLSTKQLQEKLKEVESK